MKLGYFLLVMTALTMVISGCTNRFEEFEPYSAFDDRMAEAQKGPPMMPDDQMPPPSYEQYGYPSSYNEYIDPRGGFSDEPSPSAPRLSSPNSPRTYNSSSQSMSSSNAEVPFSDSRSPKRPTNIGAL